MTKELCPLSVRLNRTTPEESALVGFLVQTGRQSQAPSERIFHTKEEWEEQYFAQGVRQFERSLHSICRNIDDGFGKEQYFATIETIAYALVRSGVATSNSATAIAQILKDKELRYRDGSETRWLVFEEKQNAYGKIILEVSSYAPSNEW